MQKPTQTYPQLQLVPFHIALLLDCTAPDSAMTI